MPLTSGEGRLPKAEIEQPRKTVKTNAYLFRSLVLSPNQAITAFQRTISQQFCNMLHVFSHPYARCCDMLGVVGSSLKMVKFEPRTLNMSQLGGQTCIKPWPNKLNISTQHSPTLLAQHLKSHTSDAICCVEMLGLFDRCFTS